MIIIMVVSILKTEGELSGDGSSTLELNLVLKRCRWARDKCEHSQHMFTSPSQGFWASQKVSFRPHLSEGHNAQVCSGWRSSLCWSAVCRSNCQAKSAVRYPLFTVLFLSFFLYLFDGFLDVHRGMVVCSLYADVLMVFSAVYFPWLLTRRARNFSRGPWLSSFAARSCDCLHRRGDFRMCVSSHKLITLQSPFICTIELRLFLNCPQSLWNVCLFYLNLHKSNCPLTKVQFFHLQISWHHTDIGYCIQFGRSLGSLRPVSNPGRGEWVINCAWTDATLRSWGWACSHWRMLQRLPSS